MWAVFSPSVSVVCACARDDTRAFASRVVGTHQEPFMGDAPTGKGIAVRGMQISTFANGNTSACHPVKGDTGAGREVRATDRDAGAAGGGPGGGVPGSLACTVIGDGLDGTARA